MDEFPKNATNSVRKFLPLLKPGYLVKLGGTWYQIYHMHDFGHNQIDFACSMLAKSAHLFNDEPLPEKEPCEIRGAGCRVNEGTVNTFTMYALRYVYDLQHIVTDPRRIASLGFPVDMIKPSFGFLGNLHLIAPDLLT